MKNWFKICVFIIFSHVVPALGQSTANYTFSTGTGESLVDMSDASPILLRSWGTADMDDQASGVFGFPNNFDFWFMGVRYTQFSVNTEGVLRLGGTAVSSTQRGINATSIPLICPLSRNAANGLGVSDLGSIKYKTVGNYPNRRLVVEWDKLEVDETTNANADNGSMQVWLYETTGEIRFVYKNGIATKSGAGTTNYIIGFSSSNTSTTGLSVNVSALTSSTGATATNNTFSAGSAITNLQSGRYFSWIPTTSGLSPRTSFSVSSITSSSMTLGWSGTSGSSTAIYFSTDSVNWSFATNVAPASTTTSNRTGLINCAKYFWRIYAVSAEGAFSAALTGTASTTGTCDITFNVTSGDWHVASNWSPAKIPTFANNVTIPAGRTVNFTSDTRDAICNNLTVNGTLNLNSSRKLRIGGNLSVSGNISNNATDNCAGGTYETVVGNIATGNQTQHCPYINNNRMNRIQFLIRASEMANYGIKPGDAIYYLTFDVVWIGAGSDIDYSTGTYGFTIRMGHTSTAAFAGAFLSPTWTTVFHSSSLKVVLGPNTHIFSSPFVWNGTDNVVIDFAGDTDSDVDQVNIKYTSTYDNTGTPWNSMVRRSQSSGDPKTFTTIDAQNSNRVNITVNGCISANSGIHYSDIDIYGNWVVNSSGQFTPAQGTVSFVGANDQTITPRSNVTHPTNTFYNLVVNQSDNGKKLTINNTNANDSVIVTNQLTLSKGVITTASDNGVVLKNNSASALVYNTSKSSGGWINGTFRRRIASNTSTYGFPMGDASNYRLCELVNNNLSSGVIEITAKYTSSPNHSGGTSIDPAKATDFGGLPYSEISNAEWQLTPKNQPTSGSYSLRLYFDGGEGTNTLALSDNCYGILKRDDASNNAWDWEAVGTINANGGTGRLLSHGYALRSNYTSFSKFTIAKTISPLPVDWLTFEIIKKNNHNLLIWKTASETNCSHFEVEKSTDGINFNKISSLKGMGYKTSLTSYDFTDYNPIVGDNFYRLKQVDFDGKYSYSPIRVVKWQENKPWVKLQSNQINANQNLMLRLENEQEIPQSIEILSVDGRLLQQIAWGGDANWLHIPLSNLNAGMYLVKINSVSGNFECLPFVVTQ